MNHTEKKYAIDRVNSIEKTKLAALKSKFSTPANWLKAKAKVELVRRGAVKMFADKDINLNGNLYLSDVFDFSQHQHGDIFESVEFEKAAAPVKAKAKEIRDCIMLGCAEDALVQIRAFEK